MQSAQEPRRLRDTENIINLRDVCVDGSQAALQLGEDVGWQGIVGAHSGGQGADVSADIRH